MFIKPLRLLSMFVILCLMSAIPAWPAEDQDRGQDVKLSFEDGVSAQRGVLLRLSFGSVLTSDGFQTTIYRDIESLFTSKENGAVEVYAHLGPSYYDPPLPNSDPTPQIMRRPGDDIIYSGTFLFRGAEEFVIELTVRYSEGRVLVRSGTFWEPEDGNKDITPSTDRYHDFDVKVSNERLAVGGFVLDGQKLDVPGDELKIWMEFDHPIREAFANNTQLSDEDRKYVTERTVYFTLQRPSSAHSTSSSAQTPSASETSPPASDTEGKSRIRVTNSYPDQDFTYTIECYGTTKTITLRPLERSEWEVTASTQYSINWNNPDGSADGFVSTSPAPGETHLYSFFLFNPNRWDLKIHD